VEASAPELTADSGAGHPAPLFFSALLFFLRCCFSALLFF